ncbi:MAG: ATP-binding protein, partial [Iodobacter sp.]
IQSQKMDALSHLSGGLAHDFNNLLGIIIANLDFIAMETEGNPKARMRCQSALDAALRGADITRRLLKLSRQQPGLPQEIKPQNVGELIHGVLALLQRTLGPEITINTFIEPDLPAIKLDTAEFENILINLAINARDAMPEDGGDIVIYLHHWRPEIFNHAKDIQPDDQHYLLLEFNDNGKGMPAEISERIFEPFFTTKAEKGTGLGLAMVYGFIKQLNGHIRVYSEPGVGTMFHLFLPIDPAAKNAAGKTSIAAEPVVGGCETILLVDDEASLREVTAEHLRSLGYGVIQAENALDAIEKLAIAGRVDLLLSDIVMPGGMDGITLAQYISEFSPDMAVLLTSGYPHKNSAADRSATLFGEILHKPYQRETLMRSVRQRIDEKIAA